MKLAFISTINSLKEISSLGEIEYCLAPFAKKNKEYFNYFKSQSEQGKYIIMDDTIAENGGELTDTEMVEMAILLKVSEIVVPDVIGDYEATNNKREKFLDKYYDVLRKHKIKIQSVIQGKNFWEYVQCLEDLNDDKRVDVVGIPFRMNYSKFHNMSKDENHMYNRMLFLSYCGTDKEIHLLGNNLPEEIVLLNDDTRIRSCDSKLMARYGFNNMVFNFEDKSKPSLKFDITQELFNDQIQCTIENIKKIKREIK